MADNLKDYPLLNCTEDFQHPVARKLFDQYQIMPFELTLLYQELTDPKRTGPPENGLESSIEVDEKNWMLEARRHAAGIIVNLELASRRSFRMAASSKWLYCAFTGGMALENGYAVFRRMEDASQIPRLGEKFKGIPAHLAHVALALVYLNNIERMIKAYAPG